MILALCLGDVIAWAAGREGEPRTGAWKMPPAHQIGHQCAAFQERLADAITVHQPRLVALQAGLPAVRGTETAQSLFGMSYAAHGVLYTRDVRVVRASVEDVRRAVMRRANGLQSKDVLDWCRGQGWNVRTPDRADAAALWCWARTLH
jgi:hypothetical protein